MIFRDNPTNYEVWHELTHYQQFKALGEQQYSAQTRLMKEQYVFDKLESMPKRWNSLAAEEMAHARWYIDSVGEALVMSVSRSDAKKLAVEYVESMDLKGYRYEFVGISYSDNWPDQWSAVFDVYTPKGNLMDGPVVFVVEKATGKVRDFEY